MTEGGTLVSKELGKELVNNELEGGMLVRREGGVGRGEGWSAEPARDLEFKVNKIIIVKEHKQNISTIQAPRSLKAIPVQRHRGGGRGGSLKLRLVFSALGASVLEPNLRNQSIRNIKSLSNVFLDVQQQSRPERVLR